VLDVEGSGKVECGGVNLLVLRKMTRGYFLVEFQQMTARVQDPLWAALMIYVVRMLSVRTPFPYWPAGQALVGVSFWG